MSGKRWILLSVALAAALYAAALISAPAPVRACAWVCTGGGASGCVYARNTCTGQISCVHACIAP
jgi:hypothetical protein